MEIKETSLIKFYVHVQGFSLTLALGHSPKIVPDVREFAVQFGQFVRDDFRKCTLYGNAVMQKYYCFIKRLLIGQISVSVRLVHIIIPLKYLFTKANQS